MTDTAPRSVSVPLGSGRALSPMQRGLWVSQLNHPDSPLQNMPLLSHLDGPVDAEKLAAAFEAVVRRSDVLRTRLSGRDAATGQWLVSLIDPEDVPRTEIVEVERSAVDDWARKRGRVPRDMAVCGYDSAIAVHEDDTVSWYLNLHHVITDATSSAKVFHATAELYGAEGSGSSGSIPASSESHYYQWARRLASRLDNPEDRTTRRAIDHWRDRAPAPRLGRLYTPATAPTPLASRVALPVGPELQRLAQERLSGEFRMLTEDLGWSTLLVTATAAYCHRITGATSLSIGMPVHNRSDPEARDLIGPTMEVFPVDVEIDIGDTFRTLHKRVGRSILAMLRHAAPGTSPSPDFDATVNIITRAEQVDFGTIAATTKWLHSGAIEPSDLLRVQMTGYAPDRADGPAAKSVLDHGPEDLPAAQFTLDINHGASAEEHRMRAAGHFMAVFSDLITEPDGAIGHRTLCGPDELDRLRHWERGADFEGDTSLVLDQLRLTLVGNPTTVLSSTEVPEDEQSTDLSGADLWRWVTGVGAWLQDHGVQPGDRVGVELPRSIESVVSIMAVMAIGGSFVPLDPAQPRSRRQQLAARAGCVRVMSSRSEVRAARTHLSETTPFTPVPRSPDDEAYLLFTSGSTGQPKGVPITHDGLARYVRFASESYAVHGDAPVAPLFSALTFDLTITSLFVPILAGGTLVVIGDDGPAGLSAIAARPDINWCKATPSHLELLVRLLPADHRLQTLVVGGEAFGSRLAADLLTFNPDMRIFNEYGPTEAVVGCMIHQVDGDELEAQPDVPIGRPAPGVTLMVVDEHLQRVPIGSPGELCISHVGVTAGYLGSEATEDDRGGDEAVDEASPFVMIDGVRFYRSGDLARLNEQDQLVYMGRKDGQVKVGGIRLEPIEVEESLNQHPLIERSAVRLWSPAATAATTYCTRCGLPDTVPGTPFDDEGICDSCHAYDRLGPLAERWFKTAEDLTAELDAARLRADGDHDCVLLLSGGRGSTYALHRLVELGFRPYALTVDNGFLPAEIVDAVTATVTDLGVDHEFVTPDSMKDILRDSLDRNSDVCHGCYKTMYTVATNRALDLGAPVVMTAVSRGRLYETTLLPQALNGGNADADAVDRAVMEARKVYHRVDDAANRLLDTEAFSRDDTFARIEYLDFHRYVDVDQAEVGRYLEAKGHWFTGPDDVLRPGCRIEAAGAFTHRIEQGYDRNAVTLAWEVRLGRLARQDAIDRLDQDLDLNTAEVEGLLHEVGYRPRPRQILTAWVEPVAGDEPLPTPAELRNFLSELLPAHAIPAAIVEVDELPLTANGKLDDGALPSPRRAHRPGPNLELASTTEYERSIIEIWERVLQVRPIGPEDDFFVMGGDSLAALEMVFALGDKLRPRLDGRTISEELAFANTTPRALAAAIQLLEESHSGAESQRPDDLGPSFATRPGQPPPLSPGELAVLFDQANRPDDIMYNVARVYRVHGPVDGGRFERALRTVAARHQPLSWSFGSVRTPLSSREAVQFSAGNQPMSDEELESELQALHRRPFDLERGPLLRCRLQPMDDGSTTVTLVIHHASGDAAGFARLWGQIDEELRAGPDDRTESTTFDYGGFWAWQQDGLSEANRDHWLDAAGHDHPSSLAVHRPSQPGPDGLLTVAATISPRRLKSRHGTSAAAVALAAVASTVRAYSDGPIVELGLIATTRTAASEDLFGYFLNTVPVRIDCGDEQPLAARADQATAAIGGAMANRAYPLARIRSDRRQAGLVEPNLDVLLAVDELGSLTLDGHRTEQRVLSNGDAVAPLTFFVEIRDDRVDLSIEHRGSVVDAGTARKMLQTLDAMLRALTASPPEATKLVPHPPSSLLVGPELRDHTPVLDQIVAHFDQASTRAAVRCGDRELSWPDLGRRATAIAERLTGHGVGPGHRVALCLDRSPELIAAIVGIHLSGAAYVPIDPGYPEERVALIATHAGAEFGLVDGNHRSLVANPLVVDADGIDGRPWPSEGRSSDGAIDFDPDRPAYVIFTSGSTGTPRGVPVSHAMLTASTNARADVYTTAPDRFLMVSSPAFDSSVVGLFWTLAAGGTVVLPTEVEAHDVAAIHRLMGQDISHTLMVPTLYQGLLDLSTRLAPTHGAEHVPQAGWAEHVPQASWAEHVIVAGEACPGSLVDAHFSTHPNSALTNEYGPTEATVWATAHHCSPGDGPVPIGPPIPGTWVAVTDGAGSIRPSGVEGDLIIGGHGLVDGYLSDHDATEDRFRRLSTAVPGVPDDGRHFRTGDRAVVVGGRLRFLGRGDTQLNLGGTRAEPEDIEDVLASVDGVTGVVAVAADVRTVPELLESLPPDVVGRAMSESATAADPAQALAAALRAGGTPRQRLIAHIELADAESAGVERADAELVGRLRERAAQGLPPLLRPAGYEIHRTLPRTPNGKLDRSAAQLLPVVGGSGADSPGSTPNRDPEPESNLGIVDQETDARDELVDDLTRLFAETLRSPTFGPDDSFFDHGGHSLLAMELLLAIEDTLHRRIPAPTLYDAPSPRELAAHLGTEPGAANRTFLVPIQPEGALPPIFAVHVLGVDCGFFRPLAARLGPDQPMYGLGQPTTDLDTAGPTDVAAVAEVYADEIDRVAPEGPISLAAISLGGVVAYELAQQLHRRGRFVTLLALFDALGPEAVENGPPLANRLEAHLRRVGGDPLRYASEQADRQGQKLQRTWERVNLGLRHRLNVRTDHQLEVRRFIEDNVNAQLTYAYDAYPGRMLVFKAADDPFAEFYVEGDMGWRAVAVGGLAVEVARGGHLSMMAEPHVESLAAMMSRALARAAEEAPPTELDRDTTERLLISGLRSGRLAATVARLGDQRSMSAEAEDLVRRTDRLLTALAASIGETASTVARRLHGAGVNATAIPTPRRIHHATAAIEVDGDPAVANRVMAELQFFPVDDLGPAALVANLKALGWVDYIRRAETTSRIRLRWAAESGSPSGLKRLGHRFAPNRRDFDMVDLPEWAWPAYWPLRPYRLAKEQLLAKAPAGRWGDRAATADLGIFLGTPPGLIAPLLEYAGIAPGQLVVDIGCGDGRVLVEAVQRFGCRGRGIETDPGLVDQAIEAVDRAGLSDRIEIIHGDGSTTPVDDADIVFAFLPPEAVTTILEPMLDQLRPDAVFLSHEQLSTDVPVAPDRSGLVLGLPGSDPARGGITVANLWHGRAEA